jgi:hypothetical protein
MSKCSYCKKEFNNKENQRTREHIFPNGLIKLFPDQNITFTPRKNYVDNSGMVIKDVCSKCNNEVLSDLDTYGCNLIEKHFHKKLNGKNISIKKSVKIDYNLTSRWLIKILYNLSRKDKLDVSWFEKSMDYILKGNIENAESFSIFAGLHVNTSPLPEYFFNYKPLEIIYKPRLLGNSMYLSAMEIDPYINQVKIQGAFNTYAIRFGSAVFYVILWNEDASYKNWILANGLMHNEFNFVQIAPKKNKYELRRVSAQSNSSMGYRHLISTSGLKQDDLIISNLINNRSINETQEILQMPDEEIEKSRTLVESIMFPENKSIQKKFKRLYDETEGSNS